MKDLEKLLMKNLEKLLNKKRIIVYALESSPVIHVEIANCADIFAYRKLESQLNNAGFNASIRENGKVSMEVTARDGLTLNSIRIYMHTHIPEPNKYGVQRY